MIEPNVFFQPACSYGVQEAECTEAIHIGSIFCHFEGDFDVGLGTEVVHLGRLHLGDDVDEIGTVAEIAVV